MKRKITAVLILTVLFSLLTGCALDGSAYAGIGVIDLATDTTWNISWYTMEGRAAETLFQEAIKFVQAL